MNATALMLMVPAILLAVTGLIYLKRGARKIQWPHIVNLELVIGIGAYIFSMGFYLLALRLEKLSVVYPLASFNYVLLALVSHRFLGEDMTRRKWLGIILIVIGSFLIVR